MGFVNIVFVFIAGIWAIGLGTGPSVIRGKMSKMVGKQEQGLYIATFANKIHL